MMPIPLQPMPMGGGGGFGGGFGGGPGGGGFGGGQGIMAALMMAAPLLMMGSTMVISVVY
jgi:hypothetical protein